MIFKKLIVGFLPIIAFPVILTSCSTNSNALTPEERNEQIFLVNQAAKNKYSPKIELTEDVNISEIDSTILNFDNIPQEDKNLSYEILNFEIPLIDSVDSNVNVKVSSKLDKEIYQTYSFKISSAIIENNFSITPMTPEGFQEMVNEVYFNKSNFLSNLINDILIRINEASDDLDITVKKFNSEATPVLESIFNFPEEKANFIQKTENYIESTILNKMNGLAFQSEMSIKVNDITKSELPLGSAELNISIVFGENSIFNLSPFLISSFSTNYLDLENKLVEILIEEIKPQLLIGNMGNNTKIPIWDLYNNLRVEIPEDIDSNNSFLIGINTNKEIPTPPNINDKFEIEIEIFSKDYSDRIKGTYMIRIEEVVNYSVELIDFSAIQPPVNKMLLSNKREVF